ncbi:D-alanyl-D-alanine carboxypeptidase/D-alanyl-D-alanine-endopeptidase [Pleurocapsales cyanobacterium LEGE 10410]|nr:D-alanyl-D-alanine carboxypeptidase/D-alanyl-D-alanine-endopeptidase [Pleurocapsales cyanobacterium LEGE 10410]
MKLIFNRLCFLSLSVLLLCLPTFERVVAREASDSSASQRDNAPRICPEDLPTAINKIINRPEFARSRWGIEIQTIEGEALYSLNGNKFFTPASSAKLLTTAAVISQLGADYRLTTPIFAVGNSPSLTSLRLKGQGDPTISTQSLKNIVHQLQSRGVKRIEKLIIDDSYFEPPTINPTWEWLDVHSYFATAVNSTILNQNTVTLTLLPQQFGQPVKFFWNDASAARQWQVINKAVTGAADIPYDVELDGELGKPVLQIRGKLAENDPPDVWDLAVVNPAYYFLESLRLHLAKAGISVTRGMVVNRPEQNELETKLTEIVSPPMQQMLAEINQESNNLYAEVLAKILAKKLNTKTPIEAINLSLTELGLTEEYVLEDASGLSRQNLVPPQTIVKTLRLMWQSPQGKFYQQSLAVAGVNGTLERRFIDTPVQGNLWGKTGTLTGVGSLSGYISIHSYPPVVFSILINNSELSHRNIRQTIDAIVAIVSRLHEC